MRGALSPAVVGTLASLVGIAALIGRNPHPHVWWEQIPAYGALFGYFGAYALILLAKSILAPWLRREESGK